MEIKIAIKELAHFICQSGNLTSEYFSSRDLEEGTKLHKYLQMKYNEKSQSEVYIKKEITYHNRSLILHGFIDGVLDIDDEIIIEEIKSTKLDFEELEPKEEHLAQLKIYTYLYALEHEMPSIHARLTYVSVVDYKVKEYDYILSLEELEDFFFDILEQYMEWVELNEEAQKNKEETIKTIKFPFDQMRPGQRDMMRACYQTMKNKDILYAIAPTGIGKTMATMFSTLKALEGKDKLFYCTAKGSGKNAPLAAIKLLEKKGLKIKTINLTAKNKICNAKFKTCKPDECPFAVGYFDRIRNATEYIFKNWNTYDEDIISVVANKFKICAFEFSLDLSYYCDIVLADYNYVFDPRVRLIRYFESDTYHPKVLVDEAHNLISRSKDMYSATICEEDIRILRKLLTGYKPLVRSDCNKLIEHMNSYREYLVEETIYVNTTLDSDLVAMIKALISKCDSLFLENKKIQNKDEVLEIYFKLLDFSNIATYYGPTHRLIAKLDKDICTISMMCLDASNFILETIEESIKGIVFFSATLTPFQYHADLLTQGKGNFLELPSPFDPANLDIIINNKVSTKYKERAYSIDTILEAIETLTNTKSGNYIVFFPSYQYLHMVVDALGDVDFDVIVQKPTDTEAERNAIISEFKQTGSCRVGFFVLGGVYAEGIDLIGDWLNGVIIVGVGLPMYCDENNILKDYFEEKYQNGFEYAYTYPGFTKVVQAVGRVIRSEQDRGVVILLDERFTHMKYQSLMPRHWLNKKVITDSYRLKKELENFFGKD
ncbi:MAG: ATP-dependent DNA helicase [Anaeroplasmataceae bacterium]|nr:ATP-dependent DNA helicase [Anaeroplasmataceae bacterium]MDE6414515.1 ATP-dependent DNA helicase [Anaeroplasmataceae bacterium]